MTISVQTNVAALVALQNLNKTASDLQEAQNQISTGLAISSAKDNASVWAIAQGQRADVGALTAVKQSLDRASSIADLRNFDMPELPCPPRQDASDRKERPPG